MRRSVIFFTALLLLPLAGCWNYSELNERTLAAGAAVDLTENGTVLLTVEAADFPKNGEPGAESMRLTGRGRNLAEAMHDVTEQNGRELYWDQASLFIVNSRYAERGIVELLDYILNEHGLRLTLLLAVSRLETAAEVLELEVHGAPLRCYALRDMIQRGGETGETISADARQVINTLLEPGREFALARIDGIAEEGSTRAEVSGCALFRGDRQIGWLDRRETGCLALFTGQLRRSVLTVPVNGGTAAVEVRNWRASLRPRMAEGIITVRAEAAAEYELLTAENLDLREPGAEEVLNRALSLETAARVGALFDRLRRLDCDGLGIGYRLRQREPGLVRDASACHAAFRDSVLSLQTEFRSKGTVFDGSVLQRPEREEAGA